MLPGTESVAVVNPGVKGATPEPTPLPRRSTSTASTSSILTTVVEGSLAAVTRAATPLTMMTNLVVVPAILGPLFSRPSTGEQHDRGILSGDTRGCRDGDGGGGEPERRGRQPTGRALYFLPEVQVLLLRGISGLHDTSRAAKSLH